MRTIELLTLDLNYKRINPCPMFWTLTNLEKKAPLQHTASANDGYKDRSFIISRPPGSLNPNSSIVKLRGLPWISGSFRSYLRRTRARTILISCEAKNRPGQAYRPCPKWI